MNFLPFENITYVTNLTEDEVTKRLLKLLNAPKTPTNKFYNLGSTICYSGGITGRQFTLERTINYRNSFKPLVTGKFIPAVYGTIINVKMRLNILATVFICIYCGLALIFFIVGLITNDITNDGVIILKVIPLLLLLFAYLLTMGSFKYESFKVKNDLKALFDADIDKNQQLAS